ncbi:MAG: hypothetical protein GY839_00160 [candidate division Zixibacteria bacterium]|nr:hypothetical protein [candidate division Zixibacteria bacterium]
MENKIKAQNPESEPSISSNNLLYLSLALFIALGLRLIFAILLEHPGHGDQAYYLTLAQNLAAGRGFEIDYIWHFLSSPDGLTHPSNDYWMPLTSVIICPFLFFFGKSLISALIPSIVFGLTLTFVTYLVGKEFSKSRAVAISSAILILFIPDLFKYSIQTDSTIFYAVFVSLGLLLMIKGQDDIRMFIPATAMVGLAHLTRQDGLLLIPVLIISLFMTSYRLSAKIRTLSYSIAVYLLVLSPFLIDNYLTFGAVLATGSAKTTFLTGYEDIYSYSKNLTLDSYLAWGWDNILLSKFKILLTNVKTIFVIFGTFFWIFLIVGILNVIISPDVRARLRPFLSPILYFAILFCFYTFIATFPAAMGGFYRSVMALIPFLIVISMAGLYRFIKSRRILYTVIILAFLGLIVDSVFTVRDTVAFSSDTNAWLGDLKYIIETSHETDSEIVIMTRGPWEVHYSTGFRAIQIPNDDRETIYSVANKFKANYLLLPAPREALMNIYDGQDNDSRFEYFTDIPDTHYKIFRIISN